MHGMEADHPPQALPAPSPGGPWRVRGIVFCWCGPVMAYATFHAPETSFGSYFNTFLAWVEHTVQQQFVFCVNNFASERVLHRTLPQHHVAWYPPDVAVNVHGLQHLLYILSGAPATPTSTTATSTTTSATSATSTLLHDRDHFSIVCAQTSATVNTQPAEIYI